MKVSVLMITYNHEKFIEEAINGVLKQQVDFDIEFIISNDCSTDATHNIIKGLLDTNINKHISFKYFNHEKNLGVMPNFIFALDQCRGNYIALCEGDDYWTDSLKLKKQVDFLEANRDFNICYHRANVLYQDTNLLEEDTNVRQVGDVTTIKDLANGNFINTPTVLLRHTFSLPKWFRQIKIGDWPLYVLVVGDKKIKCLPDVMAVYRVHDNGFWSSREEESKLKDTLNSIIPFLNSNYLKPKIKILLQKKVSFYNSKLSSHDRIKNTLAKRLNHLIKYGRR